MSYRIEYGKDCRYPISCNRKNWRQIVTVLGIVVACAGVGFYMVQLVGLENLLPGDPVVTGAALDSLMDNWQNGIPFGEVITDFCEEIVAHAQILR